MKKLSLSIGALIILALLAAAIYYFSPSTFSRLGTVSAVGATPADPLADKPNTIVDVPTEPVQPLTKPYTSNAYHFSVQMPADFTAQELDADENGGHPIVLQNSKGDGVQIYVTPDKSNGTVLTADDVRASIPDMRVVGEQDVEIGPDNTGVAFKSDNDAYAGNSREVWFYFRGNLYQISTYARLDPLLKAMFATWKFY